MSFSTWLSSLKQRSLCRTARTARPRRDRFKNRFISQFMFLEDRCLLSVFVPTLPNQGTMQGDPRGLNAVLYTPEGDASFDKNNLPSVKLVTLENNSSNAVYPIFYSANSTADPTAGQVVRVVLTNPGTGYNTTNNPALWPTVKINNLTNPGNTTAAATVKVGGDGKLYGLELLGGGAGYQSGDQLQVIFDDSANGNQGSGGAATAYVSQYNSSYALYDPKDALNRTYRGYIGEKDVSGSFVFGLQPGHQVTVQVPIAFWDGGRLYFATNGPVPFSTAGDPGNPLQNNVEWSYDATKPSYLVAPTDLNATPLYGANFKDPVTQYANPNGVVLWYNDPVKALDFGFGVPAQLTEMTFRDPKQFYIAPDMPAREIDTIINYDVSYVDNLSMPASMEGTQVPLRGAPDGATGLTPGQFAWLGSDMSFTQMQQAIASFTTNNLTPTAGVPGPNGLGTYFGGLGYDQYYMPPDNSPSGAIVAISNPTGGTVTITANVTGGLHNGGSVTISGVTGQTALNGTWVISNVSSSLTVTNFNLTGITGSGVASSGGTYTAQNTGVHMQKLPAGYQVIADSENQNVQSGFDATKFSLVSGGTKAGVSTNGTGVATATSAVITGVSTNQAALLAPGMLWSPENTPGPNPQPYFPNGTTIASITLGTAGNNDSTITMSNPANVGRSGQSWTFSGSQYTSALGSTIATGTQITNLDPNVGIYLRPGMLVTGTGIPTGTFIAANGISADFQTITLTNATPGATTGPYTFTGAPASYVVQKLIDVWYAWADYYVNQLNTAGPNLAPSGSFAGTTTANGGRTDYNSLILKVTDGSFNMDLLRVGDVVTGSAGTLTPNPGSDPSLNYTITKIDKEARTVELSLPVALPTATDATFSFSPPKFIIRSKDAPVATGTAGTIPYTLDFSTGTASQQAAALNFARTVYDVMQSFSLLLDPQTLLSRSALLLRYSIGGNVGSFTTNDGFFNQTGRHTTLPHQRTHVELRDEIKSILRGVFNFMDPTVSDPINWYPDPALPTPGARLDTGTGPQAIGFGIYNLNPYVWFVHTQLKMSGYGFSLDDDVANTTANTNSIEVAFGGNAYTAPVNTTKSPPDPPAPDLVNLEAYTGGAKFGTQQSQGYIDVTHKDFPGETRISGLKLEAVLKLVASTNPSDPTGALITGTGLPPGVTVRHVTPLNPVNGVDQSWVTFLTPSTWTPPTQDGSPTLFTFSGFTTKLPDNIAPTVTSGTPGSTVTLTGSGFTGVLGVSFNGLPGTLVAGAISSIANPNATIITISTANTAGLVNGDTVTISGVTGQTAINRPWIVTNVVANTSFQLTGSTGNGVASSGGNWIAGTDSGLKAIVPSFTANNNGTTYPGSTGKIGVRTPSGTNYSSVFFTIGNPSSPTFTGIGQPSATTASGSLKSTVTLFGSGFTGTSAVTFNGNSTPVGTFSTNATGTQLQITIPVGASGTGTFTITVGGTTYTSAGYTFTVNQPVIAPSTPFSPSSGPVGSMFTISGTGFSGADDPSTGGVTINGTAATNVTVINDTTIRVRVATGTTSGPVVVTTSAGSGNSGANNFTVSSYLTPNLQTATPNTGAAGALIQLKGQNFTGVDQAGGGITFGGIPATIFKVVDDQNINVDVPIGVVLGSAPIVVTNPSGSSIALPFTVAAATKPVIAQFSPGAGSANTSVTLTGSGFTNVTLVQFNVTQAGFVIQNDATIIATVPVGATTGPITATNGLGAGSSTSNFVIGVQPSILSFSPDHGPAGTVVTLKGSGFSAVTHVSFNGKAATTFHAINDSTLTATVPVGATTGRITVSTAGGNAGISDTNFTVSAASFQLLNNGELQKYNGGAWTTIDRNVANFQLDSTGALYDLETGGALWKYVNGVWSQLDQGVGMIALGSNNTLYDLKTNGNLWQLVNDTWTQIDSGVSTITTDMSGNLYDLKSNGNFWRLSSTGSWTQLSSSVSSFKISDKGVLAYQKQDGSIVAPSFTTQIPGTGLASYAVDDEGNVWAQNDTTVTVYANSGVIGTAGGVGSFALTPDGLTAVILLQTGELFTIPINGSETQVAANIASFSVANDGSIVALASGTGDLLKIAAGASSGVIVNTNVTSFVVGPNSRVYAIEGASTVTLDVGGRTLLDSAGVTAIEVSSNGAFYELKSNGRVWQVDVNGWTMLDSDGVTSFSVASNGTLYELKQNGNLWQVDANGWTLLDDGGATSFVVASNGTLYELKSNGRIWQVNVSGWTSLDTDATTIGLASNGSLYESRSDGAVRQLVNGTWTAVDGAVASFQLDSRGKVFELRNNGDLVYRVAPGIWGVVDSTVVSYATQEGITYLRSDGTLWSFNGTSSTQINSNVAAYLAGSDALYARMTNGDLFSYRNGVWTLLDQNALDIKRIGNGTLYELKTDGNLWQFDAGTWTQLNSGVATITGSGNGTLYAVKSDTSLWQYNCNGWLLLDSAGVNSIAVAGHGALYDLKQNGNLWLVTNSGWTKLDSGVNFMNLSVNGTLYKLKGTGEVVRVTNIDSTVVDTTVQSMALALDGTLCYLLSNGTLRKYNVSGSIWVRTDLSAGIASFNILPGGYLLIAQQSGGGTLSFNV